MSAQSSPRVETKRELLRLIAEAPTLAGTQIVYGWPKVLEDRHIILGPISGDIEIAAMTGPTGPRHRTDTFDVAIIVGAGDIGDTLEEAEDKTSTLIAAVEGIVADNAHLDNVPTVLSAQTSRIEGPDLTYIGDAQPLAYATLTVEVVARYTTGAP